MPWLEHQSRKILFVHIPRTGGTTVERWLATISPLRFRSVGGLRFSRCTPQHYTYSDIRHLVGENFFDHAYAIVRDPTARILSEYRLRRRLNRQNFWGDAESFPIWLDNQRAALASNPFLLDNHLRSQWEFLSDRVRVFRFEDGLANTMQSMATEAGLPFDVSNVGHELATSDSENPVVLDLRERTIISEMYEKDYALLNYPRP